MTLQTWVVVLAALAVVLSGLVLLGGLPTGSTPAPALTALPQRVPGFELKEFLPQVDPLFKGEEGSSHASFAPLADSSWSGKVARVGIALYRFTAADKLAAALRILALGNPLTPLTFRGQKLLEYVDASAGQVVLFWQAGTALVQVLAVASPELAPFDPEPVEAAALQVLAAALPERP